MWELERRRQRSVRRLSEGSMAAPRSSFCPPSSSRRSCSEVCTHLRNSQKTAWRNPASAGIAEDGSLIAASNSWRANGVTNYTIWS
jgi:hypothetical protein